VAAAPAEGALVSEQRPEQRQEQRPEQRDRREREGKGRDRDRDNKREKFGDRQGNRRDERDRGRDRDKRDRESGPALRHYASSQNPRERDRPVDPNSPFAKLAALKEQLAGNRKD
jgi:ATP-dependent RNA helicase SUPV3L1/SUV3